MNTANVVLSVVLAVLCLTSALADFRLVPQVVQAVERLGFPTRIVPALGLAKAVAAVGLSIGLGLDRLGTFTALCLSLYFVVAVGAHLRVKDAASETLPALVMLGLSVATFLTSL
ncbi:MAG: hypothetical protein RIS41_79 [Actinomycetota bacterium]